MHGCGVIYAIGTSAGTNPAFHQAHDHIHDPDQLLFELLMLHCDCGRLFSSCSASICSLLFNLDASSISVIGSSMTCCVTSWRVSSAPNFSSRSLMFCLKSRFHIHLSSSGPLSKLSDSFFITHLLRSSADSYSKKMMILLE